MNSFGIVIACHSGDYHLAKGCIASVRHFNPEVPICLLADGNSSTAEVERECGVRVMRRADIHDPWLRENSFGGWGYSHLIPFWEGPFDRFLYLDADCILLGDIGEQIRASDADIVIPGSGRVLTDETIINEHWFDCDFVRSFFSSFEPTGWPLFCAGTFGGKRGALDLDLYRRAFDLQRTHPGRSFHYGDQGLLNFLIFHAANAGAVQIRTLDFQRFPAEMSAEEREEAVRFLSAHLGGNPRNGMVLHYAHVKPTLFHGAGGKGPLGWIRRKVLPGEIFPEPMNHFRLRFRPTGGFWNRWGNGMKLWTQDLHCVSIALSKRCLARVRL